MLHFLEEVTSLSASFLFGALVGFHSLQQVS